MEMFDADEEGEGDFVCGVILVFATKSVVSTASTNSLCRLHDHCVAIDVDDDSLDLLVPSFRRI